MDTVVRVPTVEVCGLGEVGVAAQQHPSEAAAEAHGQRAVHLLGRAFVRRPIPWTVYHAEHLVGVGQRQHQRMIAPGAVVGDVHALLAGAGGWHQRAVHVDDRLLEKGLRLLGPDVDANVIEDVEQRLHAGAREAAAEISRGGRVGDAASAQGIEKHFVVAAQLDVLQTGAVTEGVVSEVEDVIRLVKRQVELEQVQPVVQSVDQPNLSSQGMDGADAAVTEATLAVADVVMNVARREHRLAAVAELALIQASLDAALAVGQLAGYSRIHSKSLLASGVGKGCYSSNTAKRRRISSFSCILAAEHRRLRLVKDQLFPD